MAARRPVSQSSHTTWVSSSRYARGWIVTSVLAATGWGAIAVLQSRPLPLLALVTMLGGYAGLLAAHGSPLSPTGLRRYAAGALSAAGVVLVLAGMRHHPGVALGMTAVLGASSPHLLRWVADGRSDVADSSTSPAGQRAEDVVQRPGARHPADLAEPLGAQHPGAQRRR
jgi:hypothetical protein